MIRTVIGFATLATTLATVASPATAGGRGAAGYGAAGATELTLAYMADAGFATAVKLTCDPAGGGHPTPAAACAALAEVDADPARIKPAKNACILIYQPITAQMTGVWHGRTVNWSQKFGNSCEMRRATGVLFTF
jgi:subtilisin inhibitor-like